MYNSQKKKQYPLDQSPLYKIRNRKRLARLLGLTTCELRRLTANVDTLYSEFEVPKKAGGVRGVENPRRGLKVVQARIAKLLSKIAPPDYLFCPVKGRCYVSNAAKHRGQRVIRCLDIRKYFPSTSSRRVYWFFHSVMHCERDLAAILARLATYRGHLPTGSPLSPIMAFFAHYDVWQTIASYCLTHEYQLTVYIDDVTISGRSLSAAAIWDIKRAIHRSGLRYHKEKIFIGRPAEITGVIVNGNQLLAPNRQLKKVHEAQIELRQPESDQPAALVTQRLSGLQGQIKQIRSSSLLLQ